MDDEDDGYDDELDDDEPPPKKKKRVATSTKVVLVVAGWLLLTLFLVGEFSKTRVEPDSANAELETTTDDGDDEEVFETETEAEAAFDFDGDGVLDEEERAAFEAAVEAGEVIIGEPTVSGTDGGGSLSDPDGETAAPAVAGAAPASGTTTTTTSAASGDGATTTTMASSSSTTTTTKAAPPPTTEAPGDPVPLTVTASDGQYNYPSGYDKDLSLPTGSTISFKNNETSANISHSFSIVDGWDSGTINKTEGTKTSPALAKGSYTYRCKVHPSTMNGTLTVT